MSTRNAATIHGYYSSYCQFILTADSTALLLCSRHELFFKLINDMHYVVLYRENLLLGGNTKSLLQNKNQPPCLCYCCPLLADPADIRCGRGRCRSRGVRLQKICKLSLPVPRDSRRLQGEVSKNYRKMVS